MRIVTSIEEMQHQISAARARGERIGHVSTRGDLHDGHAALLRVARAQCDFVICSIVRPIDGPAIHEIADERVARDAGTDLIWRPLPGPLYKDGRIQIVPTDAQDLAPIATSDTQALGLIRPDVTYVSDGHYEHARLLSDVVRELYLPVEVRVAPSPRTPDGLPMGTARIVDEAARQAAAFVPRVLDSIHADVSSGERSLFRLRARTEGRLADAGELLTIDDVSTVDPVSFSPVDVFDRDVLLVVKAHTKSNGETIPIVDSRLLER